MASRCGPVRSARSRLCSPDVDERLDRLLPKKRFDLIEEFTPGRSRPPSCSTLRHAARSCRTGAGHGQRLTPRTTATIARSIRWRQRRGGCLYARPMSGRGPDAGPDGSVPLIDGMFDFEIDGRRLTVEEITPQLVCAFIGEVEIYAEDHGRRADGAGRPSRPARRVGADLATNVPKAAEEIIRCIAPAQWFMPHRAQAGHRRRSSVQARAARFFIWSLRRRGEPGIRSTSSSGPADQACAQLRPWHSLLHRRHLSPGWRCR